MDLEDRISAFAALGTAISNFRQSELDYIYAHSIAHNTWFTSENVRIALAGVQRYLQKEKLQVWTNKYTFDSGNPKWIGLVMAGNIPLVGFHDFLSVLISGHKAKVKLSHQDPFLLPYLVKILAEIAPPFQENIDFVNTLTAIDAIIATGSDNSSRYFKYYFSKYPHIIRQNRTSVAILTGEESKEELHTLGKDIFQYYGLGCRNVSKLYVPKGYVFDGFFQATEVYGDIANHTKYGNNYDYNRAIYLINRDPHLDCGFLVLKEDKALASPVSTVHYEFYTDEVELKNELAARNEEIQCIVGHIEAEGILPFGKTQEPELWDYADGIDTIKFILEQQTAKAN